MERLIPIWKFLGRWSCHDNQQHRRAKSIPSQYTVYLQVLFTMLLSCDIDTSMEYILSDSNNQIYRDTGHVEAFSTVRSESPCYLENQEKLSTRTIQEITRMSSIYLDDAPQ